MIKYIIYIVLIMIVNMLFIYIGIIKDRQLGMNLMDKLYNKCCNKVLKNMKVTKKMSAVEIRELIKDEKASVIWSKKKVGVTNKIQFTNYVIEGLLKLNEIELIDKSKRIYGLSESSKK